MKDIFVERSKAEFGTVLQSFIDSLRATFPKCGATKDWALWYENMIKGDDAKMEEGIKKWADSVATPLLKGTAKYLKAVQSITGSEATVHHALAYRDAEAANGSSEYFRDLDLPSKLTNMKAADADVFWKYLQELTRLSLVVTGRTAPVVPTPKDIDEDIRRRKQGKSLSSASSSSPAETANPVLQKGAHDMWKTFCLARGATCDESADFSAVVSHAMQADFGEGETVGAACKRRDPVAFAAFQAKVPCLAATANDAVPTNEEWDMLDKIAALCTMDASIPNQMMRGIEGVAARLMDDIAAGRASLDDLNVEAIGNEVLAGVSAAQIDEFAKNIDKILPALQQMR